MISKGTPKHVTKPCGSTGVVLKSRVQDSVTASRLGQSKILENTEKKAVVPSHSPNAGKELSRGQA